MGTQRGGTPLAPPSPAEGRATPPAPSPQEDFVRRPKGGEEKRPADHIPPPAALQSPIQPGQRTGARDGHRPEAPSASPPAGCPC